jgi:hypothetical protein
MAVNKPLALACPETSAVEVGALERELCSDFTATIRSALRQALRCIAARPKVPAIPASTVQGQRSL